MPCRLSPHREAAVRARLAHFFGGEFDLPLNVPLWQLVDLIQGRWPDWPEGMTEPCWDRSS